MAARDGQERIGSQSGESLALMKTAAEAGVNFLAGFLMSAGRIGGGWAPFGVSAVVRAGHGVHGASALAGAALGYLVTGGLDWGIRYVAACVLAFTTLFVLQEGKTASHPWFSPAVSAGAVLITGALSALTRGAGADGVLSALAEAVLSGGGAYFLAEATAKTERVTEASERRRDAAIVISAACALTALNRVAVLSVVSVGRVLALLLVMAAAFKGGSLVGAAAGTAFGAAMDLSAGGSAFFTFAYALSALVSGAFGKHGRLLYLTAFILTNALAALCAPASGFGTNALFEVFAASVIFMLIPPAALSRVCSVVSPPTAGAGESGLRRYAARRADGIARAYGDVCAVVRRGTDSVNDNDVARVFDRAADAACLRCKKRDECWTRDYNSTLDALNSATKTMTERGRLEAGDLPAHFTEKCTNLPAFIAAVNAELRASAYRRQYRSRLEENRAAAWSQYEDFSLILKDISRELGSGSGADPLSERRLLRYLRSLDMEADAAVFRDASGRLRAVIESGRLKTLTDDPAYLDKLSAVLGVRLCRPNTGGEGRLTLLEAEPLAVSVGIAAMKKQGESENGDRGTYFKTDSGTLCVILSDGMGTGGEAARESAEAVSILERFLRCGVDPATAMKILNSVLLLRNGDEWGFATVDLMCVDLFSGETCFYKYGAAPSYVKCGKTIRRVRGESLAAGLMSGEGSKPDLVRMRLRPGSLAVIASDGVLPDGEDEWLRDILRAYEDDDMKSTARRVLRASADKYGGGDDMTVLAVRVDRRA